MNPAFKVHKLTGEGLVHAATIATSFDRLLDEIAPLVGEGRELALVKTKLEEACFFAKKGMAATHSQDAA